MLGRWVVCPINPASQRDILKIFAVPWVGWDKSHFFYVKTLFSHSDVKNIELAGQLAFFVDFNFWNRLLSKMGPYFVDTHLSELNSDQKLFTRYIKYFSKNLYSVGTLLQKWGHARGHRHISRLKPRICFCSTPQKKRTKGIRNHQPSNRWWKIKPLLPCPGGLFWPW